MVQFKTSANYTRGDSRTSSWLPLFVPGLLALLLALGSLIAQPFVGNQNQYILHVLADRQPAIAADWLAGTTDPYPFFTLATGLVYDVGSDTALRLLALVGTWIALIGVYLLAATLTPVKSRLIPVLTLVVVGVLLNPFAKQNFGAVDTNAFRGLAGQYIVSHPAYVQPSLAGTLLLVALPMWLRAGMRRSTRRRYLVAAWLLTAGACMIHPTYLTATAIGLAAGALVDSLTGKPRSGLLWYSGALLSILFLSLLANPSLMQLALASGSDAQVRFAFERISHHTLWPNWSRQDILLLALFATAIVLVRRVNLGRWLQLWIGCVLAISVGSALVVNEARFTWLALLFPWRVTVILAPLSVTIVIVVALTQLSQHVQWQRKLRAKYVLWLLAWVVCGVSALNGIGETINQPRPASADPYTELVLRASPSGVGLIPLNGASSVRLNAAVPVYVDWKSPPYAGTDLEEWWRRYDEVQAFQVNPEVFCDAAWSRDIDWMLVPSVEAIPSCVETWEVRGRSDSGAAVLQR